MLTSALCSITFRKLTPHEIINLCVKSKIQAIEWGGDVHVPHGDLSTARLVRKETEAAGLQVSAYGSYYRCDEDQVRFQEVLASAKELGTSVIRIWAGNKGSADAAQEERIATATAIRQAVGSAKEEGITVALEYHGGTLTDTMESTHQLLQEVHHPDLKIFWQPRTGGTFEQDIRELEAALPYLSNVHCFHWNLTDSIERLALADGLNPWMEYLKIIRKAEGDRFITLEFVRDDSPDQLKEDAETLHQLLKEANS